MKSMEIGGGVTFEADVGTTRHAFRADDLGPFVASLGEHGPRVIVGLAKLLVGVDRFVSLHDVLLWVQELREDSVRQQRNGETIVALLWGIYRELAGAIDEFAGSGIEEILPGSPHLEVLRARSEKWKCEAAVKVRNNLAGHLGYRSMYAAGLETLLREKNAAPLIVADGKEYRHATARFAHDMLVRGIGLTDAETKELDALSEVGTEDATLIANAAHGLLDDLLRRAGVDYEVVPDHWLSESMTPSP